MSDSTLTPPFAEQPADQSAPQTPRPAPQDNALAFLAAHFAPWSITDDDKHGIAIRDGDDNIIDWGLDKSFANCVVTLANQHQLDSARHFEEGLRCTTALLEEGAAKIEELRAECDLAQHERDAARENCNCMIDGYNNVVGQRDAAEVALQAARRDVAEMREDVRDLRTIISAQYDIITALQRWMSRQGAQA